MTLLSSQFNIVGAGSTYVGSLDRQSENYRKIRNSIRFILGNLKEWDPNEKVEHNELPELERYIRHRLYTLNEKNVY